jgi:hypothetical protein
MHGLLLRLDALILTSAPEAAPLSPCNPR